MTKAPTELPIRASNSTIPVVVVPQSIASWPGLDAVWFVALWRQVVAVPLSVHVHPTVSNVNVLKSLNSAETCLGSHAIGTSPVLPKIAPGFVEVNPCGVGTRGFTASTVMPTNSSTRSAAKEVPLNTNRFTLFFLWYFNFLLFYLVSGKLLEAFGVNAVI